MYSVIFSNELYHHGIKGQKWGVRRYQNEDGSYTDKGRKRYGMDLDINDKSRRNIAKIRTGEAKRRLDVAKSNNSTNTYHIADLQGRVRSAKKNERDVKKIDKGAALAAKGVTRKSLQTKSTVAFGAAALASYGMTTFLNKRLSDLSSQGRYTPNHTEAAKLINNAFGYAVTGAAIGYGLKLNNDARNIAAYNRSRWNGTGSVKSVGSSEYADVVNRRKGK